MAFAIIRTAKLKTAGNLGGLNNHLERTMEVPNADQDLTYLNKRLVGSGDLAKDVANRIQAAGIEKPRKNAVLAIEHLMTASPEAFRFEKKAKPTGIGYTVGAPKEDIDRWRHFEESCYQWLAKRYGKDNLINFTVHVDEQTPHIHAIVVPIDEKGKLNCRHYLGGREKLRDLQDSFAQQHIAIGLERGIPGSKAHHTTVKQFYGQAKSFEQAPSPVILLDAPVASIQAPETNFLGQMKQTPQEYAQGQEKRLKTELATHHRQTVLKAQEKAQELHRAAQASQVLKLENERLKGQLKGIQRVVEQLNHNNRTSKALIEAIAKGQIQPQELAKALQQAPQTEREKNIHAAMKQAGCQVKEPELKKEEKKELQPKPAIKRKGPRL